jgi:hypothetical protein
MSPVNTWLDIGETAFVTLNVNSGVDIHQVHAAVSYNTSVVQVIDEDVVAPGVQVLPGPFPGDDVAGAVLQNTVSSGIINYQYELDSGEVSGSGTVATIQFLALANGSADLAWSVRQFTDANGVMSNPSGSTAVLLVGIVDTPTPQSTATATITSTPTRTPTPAPTGTTTSTPAATGTPTRTATITPTSTGTPAATSTPRVTILQDSNTTPAAGRRAGVDPSQTGRANGLPDAGNDGPSIQWWRWTFFVAALLFGIAGWFFTFALHHGNREVVLLDKWDRGRRRRGRS